MAVVLTLEEHLLIMPQGSGRQAGQLVLPIKLCKCGQNGECTKYMYATSQRTEKIALNVRVRDSGTRLIKADVGQV